jgi:hypothetical protein
MVFGLFDNSQELIECVPSSDIVSKHHGLRSQGEKLQFDLFGQQ